MQQHDPDLPLIEAMAAGNRDALEQLYARHGLHLLNFLIREIGERSAAEDALQVVMLAAWNGARRFRRESLTRTWLFAIARRQASKARRSLRHPTYTIDETRIADDAPRPEPLDDALTQLNAIEREALELVFYQGCTLPDAADHLKIPLNTLRSRLYRARQNLRRILENERQREQEHPKGL